MPDMTKEFRTQLRDVKKRIKKAASDLAAARRTNASDLKSLAKARRQELRDFAREEAAIHKDNRLAEKEHGKTTRSLLKRQAVLEGRLAS